MKKSFFIVCKTLPPYPSAREGEWVLLSDGSFLLCYFFFFVCVEIVCYTSLSVEDLSIDTFHNIQSLQRLVNCEKVEVNDVSHSLVALSIGVEIVVLEEVLGIHAEGVLWVAHGMLHLDDTI